jgi:hypothetical protein
MTGYIDIELTGDASYVTKMLLSLEAKLSPNGLTGFLGVTVFPYLLGRAKQRFQNEGDDVVGKWAPLAPATELIRTAQGFSPAHPINKRTGELENYITQGSISSSVLQNPMGAVLTHPSAPPAGKLASKVRTAQRGDPKFARGVPARPVLGMNESDLSFVMIELAFYVGKP